MTKAEKIQEALNKPFKVGDIVKVIYPYTDQVVTKAKKSKNTNIQLVDKVFEADFLTLHSIEDDNFVIDASKSTQRVPEHITLLSYKFLVLPKQYVFHNTFYVGENPFIQKPWKSLVKFISGDIESLL